MSSGNSSCDGSDREASDEEDLDIVESEQHPCRSPYDENPDRDCLEPDQEICPYLDSSTALSHNYIISFENESEKYFNNNLFIEKHEESYELRW